MAASCSSSRPIRSEYRALVWYVAAMNVLFGVIMVAVDLHAGMPLLWTLAEGPPIAMMGVALGVLNWQASVAPAVQLAGR